jgi:hypothetical protein
VIKRIVALLVGGFVSISIAVAFIPTITGIVTSGTSGATKVLLDICLWVIPLGVGFLIVLNGIRPFTKKGRARMQRQDDTAVEYGKRMAHRDYRRTGHW